MTETTVGNEPEPDVSLTGRQREILEFIDQQQRDLGYPPSVREIGSAVGLTSPSTVHSHLATLQRLGFIRRDPTKPRALEVHYDPTSGAVAERRPVRHVPLVGDVAAGTDVLAQQNVEEVMPIPADLTGDGELFMLRVRGDSMIEAGILDGDFVVARSQPSADIGEIVVAGIPGDEATIKTLAATGKEVVLQPSNSAMSPMRFQSISSLLHSAKNGPSTVKSRIAMMMVTEPTAALLWKNRPMASCHSERPLMASASTSFSAMRSICSVALIIPLPFNTGFSDQARRKPRRPRG
jgi:repressor LexA